MKTTGKQIAGFLIILFLALSVSSVSAQNESHYTSVSGVVKDKKSKKKLEYVNVSIPGTGIGTITNEDGEFLIKINDSINAKELEISHLGYFNYKFPIDKRGTPKAEIFLTANVNLLDEVIVESMDPLELVKRAIDRIGNNYCPETNLMTGFYRETIKKGRNYINISEAVIDIYKTPYDKGAVDDDRIQIEKGRKLLSQKSGDTLAVKLIGGPNLSVYLDIAKNKDLLLDKEALANYKFKMEESVMIDERPHFVVSFAPQVNLPYALYFGKLYIDKQSIAFTRAEFSLSMDDRNKATQAILKKKPFNLRFKPEEVSFMVTYKLRDGVSYLNYIRSEFRFKCDWKRKLFYTNYSIVSEMVVTSGKVGNVDNIPSKLAFKQSQSLSDNVSSFRDANFWEDYNIIEPSESLESAVTKLKKQH
ncbi:MULTISPECIES: carboxypeptidase-like regulatory domain-containing protein [unclassified Dysgonomonas]|uniref:carboxypeptidase-like regulatory domain-containing protein n=1 Tax=unclassified Dysgonomonas TaxID=2630389 RepID=UPI0006836F46|nr:MULTISPECIES: carboxypeptidase-like regulatory domain-containing protein [unclassified Dysgonomonas]MBD8349846.1 carboxypeptidase-like regulatory domain-containing protein [Dysgonomonas sp. HGC4]MBF0577478.1 carboxypeptidase-like regulatory domain-containing protein [Dysgonomonas sp. GY617]